MEKGQSFSGKDFLGALRDHATQPTSSHLKLIGTVKDIKGDDSAIAFSPDGQCKDWVTIPLDRIEKIEILGKSSCDDNIPL